MLPITMKSRNISLESHDQLDLLKIKTGEDFFNPTSLPNFPKPVCGFVVCFVSGTHLAHSCKNAKFTMLAPLYYLSPLWFRLFYIRSFVLVF